MANIAAEKLAALQANIFPAAHSSVGDWESFNWHNYRGAIDSDVPHSSQAFCISVWGSLFGPDPSVGTGTLRRYLDALGGFDFIDGAAELVFEFSNRSLLNEQGQVPTCVDALLTFQNHVVVVESKLTEGFGSCSQPKNRSCNGDYLPGSDLKTNSDAPCRLQIQDGSRTPRRYWEELSLLSGGEWPHSAPCPFSGPMYQVMRNVALASALARKQSKDWRVLFAMPVSAEHGGVGTVEQFVQRLDPSVRSKIRVLDYEVLSTALSHSDSAAERDLGDYMANRLALVS